jgi:hypothetical protein
VFSLSWLRKARKAGRGVKSVKSASATRCPHTTLLRQRGQTDFLYAFAARDVVRLGPRLGREVAVHSVRVAQMCRKGE